MFFWICKIIGWIPIKILLPHRVRGRKNIPKSNGRGLILCCNHTSIFDPVYLMLNCRRRIFFMAKEELFKNVVATNLLKWFGVFAVKRGAGDTGAIDKGAEIINKGKIMGIFPEGRRSKDFTPKKAKVGVAYIAQMTNADILPVSLHCEGKIKLFKRVTVRFGEVIKYEDLGLTEGESNMRELKAAADKIMGEITNLWSKGHE